MSHSLSGLNNGNVLSPSCGGYKVIKDAIFSGLPQFAGDRLLLPVTSFDLCPVCLPLYLDFFFLKERTSVKLAYVAHLNDLA